MDSHRGERSVATGVRAGERTAIQRRHRGRGERSPRHVHSGSVGFRKPRRSGTAAWTRGFRASQRVAPTTPWTLVPSLTTEGIEDLLRILHGQPAYPKPAVGARPVPPPRPPVPSTAGLNATEGPVLRREIDPPELMPDEYATGTFNLHMRNGPLNAHLRNQGGSTAEITEAKLSTFIGDFEGRCGPRRRRHSHQNGSRPQSYRAAANSPSASARANSSRCY